MNAYEIYHELQQYRHTVHHGLVGQAVAFRCWYDSDEPTVFGRVVGVEQPRWGIAPMAMVHCNVPGLYLVPVYNLEPEMNGWAFSLSFLTWVFIWSILQ